MDAFWLSIGVVFLAELGDKSQLMALTFAARYRALPVLIGVTIATTVVHAISVVAGSLLRAAIPTEVITFIAGVAFLGFAAWTIRGDRLDEEESAKADRVGGRSAVVAASIAFFLAELGDKTMLATVTLATRGSLLAVWIGSTIGMVLADALAIGVGQVLGSRLPERWIRIGAAVAFVVFGAVLIAEAIVGS